MGRTFIRQATQIRKSFVYDDTIQPSAANYETNPVHVEDDLNSLRSQTNNFLNRSGVSFPVANWYDDISAPVSFENGISRGINDLNQDLHDLQRKRILDHVLEVGKDITVGAATNLVILGTGELPSNTTAAVGAVSTRGTVVAFSPTFGSHSLDEVSSGNALSPHNKCLIFDASTGKPIQDASGNDIFGLLQSETAADAHTITDTTTTRVQLSFVKYNATFDDLIAAANADIENQVINYARVERFAFEDLPEGAFLSPILGDLGAANTNRQAIYDNQGAATVSVTTNSTLDISAGGSFWQLRDAVSAPLWRLTEGSGGGTTELRFFSDLDIFNNDAVLSDFANGATIRSTGTRPIVVGTADGEIGSSAGDLMVRATSLLAFSDGNFAGSTWATDLVLSDSSGEWDLAETNFGGEFSILNMLNQAFANGGANRGVKTYSRVNTQTAADVDLGGVAGGANLDTQLPDMSLGAFLTDYDTFLNGVLIRPGANAAANFDYYPGTSLANGQIKLESQAEVDDVLCVIPWA